MVKKFAIILFLIPWQYLQAQCFIEGTVNDNNDVIPFANIELKNSIFVLQTQGVSSLVKFGEEFAIVQNEVINAIKLAIDGGYKLTPTEYFIAGSEVEVIEQCICYIN